MLLCSRIAYGLPGRAQITWLRQKSTVTAVQAQFMKLRALMVRNSKLHPPVAVLWKALENTRRCTTMHVLARRWVIERTFSWLGQNRRMSKDYERLAESSEAFVYVAMTRLMARRLARQ